MNISVEPNNCKAITAPVAGKQSTRYETLAERFRSQIHSGAWASGDRLPSFSELRRDGFTIQTIEKAQSLLETEGLIERRARSGVYVAQRSSRNVDKSGRQRTGIIGFCGTGFSLRGEPYWSHLLDGVYEGVGSELTNVVLLKLLPNASGWDKVDGVLLAGLNFEDHYETVSRLLPPNVPAVSLLSRGKSASSVIVDDYEGSFQMTVELIRQGHREIALVSHAGYMMCNRVQGYQAAMRQAGLDAEVLSLNIQPSDQSFFERGEHSVRHYMNRVWATRLPTAVMMHNDQAAIGAIRSFEAAGIRVPRDISVTGYDDSESEGHFRPLLSTVHVPLREVGIAGVELLHRQIKDQDAMPRTVMLPATVAMRQSSAPLRN